jgi:hypothetical protein
MSSINRKTDMADDPGILAGIGIRVSSFFAGTAGGLVGAWADEKASLGTWIAYAICGGLTANYLGADAMHFMPSWVSEGGAGFVVGGSALVIVRAIKGLINSWRPQLGGGK